MTHDVTIALSAYHIFTGCDSVSAFACKRELSGFTLPKKEPQYQETFWMLGQSYDVPVGAKFVVEFIYHLYGVKVTSIS